MIQTQTQTFLDYEKIRKLSRTAVPSDEQVSRVLNKALQLKGLSTEEAAILLQIRQPEHLVQLLRTASKVKQEIYGRRMVLFAPIYTGNYCSNNCTYCAFRTDNKDLPRVKLSPQNIEEEVSTLLAEGHKRLLMLCGESRQTPLEETCAAIRTAYGVKYKGDSIRRINVEIAPLTVEEFRQLKKENIGTYTCFQESYDPELYAQYHPSGPKSDFVNRLYVMDRAMEAGVDDVGIGVLFGLADYRYEVLSILEHAAHLEKNYGCGPHTVSVPRIEPASGAPTTENIPYPVSDEEFKKIIAVIRIAMPYTGIILSTREPAELRKELFNYGISQVSAGSKTAPGGYSHEAESQKNGQFFLGDQRSLEEVISGLIDDEYIPSFCTGCYRKGRVGNDFMDLAKPGLIKKFCMPNGISSFAEYLQDYASPATREKGFALIGRLLEKEVPKDSRQGLRKALASIKAGERDLYL